MKLSKAQLYGTPSPRKLEVRLNGLRAWATSVSLLREIHTETRAIANAIIRADVVLQDSTTLMATLLILAVLALVIIRILKPSTKG
jgi:hypothetical protein